MSEFNPTKNPEIITEDHNGNSYRWDDDTSWAASAIGAYVSQLRAFLTTLGSFQIVVDDYAAKNGWSEEVIKKELYDRYNAIPYDAFRKLRIVCRAPGQPPYYWRDDTYEDDGGLP